MTIPTAKIVALLVNPTDSNAETLSRSLQAPARTFGMQLHVLNASTEGDFDTVFATLGQLKADGLMIGSDVFLTARSKQLAALAVRHAVPAIFFPEPRVCSGRRSDELHGQHSGYVPSGWSLHGPDS